MYSIDVPESGGSGPVIRTCAQREIRDVCGVMLPDAIISISDPEDREHADYEIEGKARDTLALVFNDVENLTHGAIAPAIGHVERLLTFLHDVRTRAPDPRILIHCHAGLSRSTAIAAVALADFAWGREAPRDGEEGVIGRRLLAIEPLAIPNQRVLRAAERVRPMWRGRLHEPLMRAIAARDEGLPKNLRFW